MQAGPCKSLGAGHGQGETEPKWQRAHQGGQTGGLFVNTAVVVVVVEVEVGTSGVPNLLFKWAAPSHIHHCRTRFSHSMYRARVAIQVFRLLSKMKTFISQSTEHLARSC